MESETKGFTKITVIRNSPNWKASSDLWLSKKTINPELFLPNPLPPGFPESTLDLIKTWNNIFTTDFFLTRHRIKELSREHLLSIGSDFVLSQNDFILNIDSIPRNSLVYFIDDDDFAIPSLFEHIEPYFFKDKNAGCIRWSSISMGDTLLNRRVEKWFPRARPWLLKQIELRPQKLGILKNLISSKANIPGATSVLAIGPLHTNNYVINLNKFNPPELLGYIDHMNASNNIWKRKVKVISLERKWLSFTNKHPASITTFSRIAAGCDSSQEIIHNMRDYINSFEACAIDKEICWMKPIHGALSELYKSVI